MSDYGIWTKCFNPEWLKQNAGNPYMWLADTTTLRAAQLQVARLQLLIPEADFEISEG